MKFEDKFKPGDIIYSDRFHNGLCMVVESGKCGFTRDEFRYSCQDLVRENQLWAAYEFDSYMFNLSYAWRIATDDYIANYLSRFLHTPLGKVGDYEVSLTDAGVKLDVDGECEVYFTAEELIQLGKIISERVVR